MPIVATQAAKKLEQQIETVSSYQMIALLFDGALERIDQARESFLKRQLNETELLIRRVTGIVNGLRSSLDMERGGEVAANLDALYSYILMRLEAFDDEKTPAVLDEVKLLITEVKIGWDSIETTGLKAAVG